MDYHFNRKKINVATSRGVIYHPPATFLKPPYNIILKNVVRSRGDGEKNVVGGRGVQIFLSYRPSPNFKNGTALSKFF